MSAALNYAGQDGAAATEILTFRLGSNAFAMEVRHVREVLDYKPIAPVAGAPSNLIGMIDVRGTGVPVVDLKRKLGMHGLDMGPTPDTRIIVLEFLIAMRPHTVAIVADAVHEVSDVADQKIEQPPQFGESWKADYMQGLGRRGEEFMTLLDIGTLFADRDGAVFEF